MTLSLASRHHASCVHNVRFAIATVVSLAFGMIIFTTEPVSAQPASERSKATPEQMVERRLAQMTKALNLTPEQANKIKPILENNAKEMLKIRQDRKTAMESLRARREASNKEILAVLTPEQQSTFTKRQEQMREHTKQRLERRKERLEKRLEEKH